MKANSKKKYILGIVAVVVFVALISFGLIVLITLGSKLKNNKNTNKIQKCTEFAAKLQNKSEKEALDALQLNQSTFRVVSRDGELFPVTEDFNENRVNLYIENGKVSKVGCG